MKRFPLAPVAALGTVTLGKMVNNGKGENRGGDVRPYLRAANIQPFGVVNPGAHGNEMWFSDAEMDSLDLIKGDVLVVEGGAAGRTSVLREDLPGWGFQNSIVRVRVPHGDGRFLAYALQSAHDQGLVSIQTNVSTIPHFSAEKVSRFRVPTTSPNAQRRIADYLDAETAQIDGMLAELDVLIGKTRQRHSLATDWVFTMQDLPTVPLWSLYEPVKLQGYRDEEVLSVYRDHGVVPKSSRDDNNNRTPDNLTTYQLVEPGWLVVNKMKAWQGSMGISRHRGIVSPDYQVARPITNDVPEYLHEALRSARMVPEYRGRSKGIRPSQWRLYWQDMASIHVPVPSVEVQRQLLDEIRASRQATDAMLADANRLKELLIERRAALITDVITGKKEVPA